jgi:alpha-methylacyl-CoA racemase
MDDRQSGANGPLRGIKIVEIAGKGPAPYCAMLLADMGADVIRIDCVQRSGRAYAHCVDPLQRGRRSIAIDLKHPDGRDTLLSLVENADALIEGFRPGVMERLGVGPEPCRARNPALVYGRVTGWGQDGPLAQSAGHDLNYIALTGALHAIGQANAPPPAPLALIGDFGGGGVFLALGVIAAVLEARSSGRGQVVDAAMVEGASSLMTFVYGLRGAGWWRDEREANMLDGGAHFYSTYETKDGKYISLGPIEPEFHREMLNLLEIDDTDMPPRMDRTGWHVWKDKLQAVFRRKTRDEWCALLDGTDACFAPVLTMGEAPDHPQNRARGTFVEHSGVIQPAPTPRFERTPGEIQRSPPKPGEHTTEALVDWGFDIEKVNTLLERGALGSL